MSQKLIFAIIAITFFHISYTLFFINILIEISQKLKDLSNIFTYQKNKLVLNKISSIKSQGLVKQILRKLGFKLSIIEAELNLLDAYKKKSVFQPKICTPLLFIMKFSKRNQFTLNCSVEYFTRIIFCESFQGISHMPYAGGFSHFGQKKQFKIKIKLKQRKIT